MSRLLVIDSDTILYASAANQQTNKCNAIHLSSGREKLFDSKTAFNSWVKQQDKWGKDEFECQTVAEVTGEPRFAFQSIKQKVDKIIHAAGCDDYIVCIEGEGNFRDDFEAEYVDYKGHRGPKPLLFEDCREYFIKKYQKRVIFGELRETDDVCNELAWRSYRKGKASRSRDDSDVVLAYVDKDLAANSRGWMLNYNKLEQGIFWNNGYDQPYNFAVQMLMGDSADNIPGIVQLSEDTREKYGVKVKGVGMATANKILTTCKTNAELIKTVEECYVSAYGKEEGYKRMNENGFFLYLLRSEDDAWSLERYLED